jgi:hypothetical protein
VVRTPYEATVRLLGWSAHYWEVFDGELASRGISPFDLRIDRLCNTIYSRIIQEGLRGLEATIDELTENLNSELAKPLPGRRHRVTQDSIDDEMALFRKAQQNV